MSCLYGKKSKKKKNLDQMFLIGCHKLLKGKHMQQKKAKRLTCFFWFLNYLQFSNHIWKPPQGKSFLKYPIFACVPSSSINDDQFRTIDKKNCCVNFLYRQNNCTHLVTKYHLYWFDLSLNQNYYFFYSIIYYMKAASFQNILTI